MDSTADRTPRKPGFGQSRRSHVISTISPVTVIVAGGVLFGVSIYSFKYVDRNMYGYTSLRFFIRDFYGNGIYLQ